MQFDSKNVGIPLQQGASVQVSNLVSQGSFTVQLRAIPLRFHNNELEVFSGKSEQGAAFQPLCLQVHSDASMDSQCESFIESLKLFERFSSFQILADLVLESLPSLENKKTFSVDYCVIGSTLETGIRRDIHDSEPKPHAIASNWIPFSEWRKSQLADSILATEVIKELQWRVRCEGIFATALPQEFTLSEMQKFVECLHEKKFDVRNFRKRLLNMGILTESTTKSIGVAYRPPRLYSVNQAKVKEVLTTDGEIRFF